MDPAIVLITQYVQSGALPPDVGQIASAFCRDYRKAIKTSGLSDDQVTALLTQLIELAVQQIKNPYPFGCVHQKIRAPFDYTQFGQDLIGPLVDMARSSVKGEGVLKQIERQLSAGDSCIFLANHQIEADPQVMHLLLSKQHPKLTDMYFVAGNRVTTDPLAVPLSLGTNMICIFSKKHIEHPPELKEEKLLHNRRAMQQLGELLNRGGCSIWVAPSGGRDRANAEGTIEIAPFDPQSVEMFHLLAKQAAKPVHFYPLALATYHLLPPPPSIQKEIGEPRKISRTAAHLAFGPEIDFGTLAREESDKKERRRLRAELIWTSVKELYSKAISNASAMLDT